MSVLARLADEGYELPPAPQPAANYVPWTRSGRTVYVSGQIPSVGGKPVRTGSVGKEVQLADALSIAGVCARNAMAVLSDACAANGCSLDDIRIVRVSVFVASATGFHEQHLVANGASDLFGKVFGEAGIHARSAVGVAELPLGVPVEVEVIAELPEGVDGATRAQ